MTEGQMSHIRLLFQTKASWQLTRWANESTTNLGYRKVKVKLTCLKSTQSFKSITHYSSNWFNVVVIFSLLTITLSRVLMSNSDETKYFFVSCSVIMAVATSGTLEWRDSYNETLNCGFRRLKGQRYHGTERTAALKSSGNNWGDN